MSAIPKRTTSLRIPLPAGDSLPFGVSLAATLHWPEERICPGSPVLFMFPGAGYARGYFDIRPDGFESYSEAEHHVTRGMVVVAIDHLGAGDSSLPEDEALMTPLGDEPGPRFDTRGTFSLQMMAAACDAGTRAVMNGLRTGALHSEMPAMPVGAAIGIGQSMGGHVIVIAQAEHGTFDAIGVLGSSFTQTRLMLLPGRRYPARDAEREVLLRGAQMDTDMWAAFHWPDEPAALVAADMDPAVAAPWRSRAIPRCAGRLMEPSIVAREAAAVRVPVFLAYGESDVTLEPLADAAMFRSTTDLTLLVVPRMAHMHNFAASRRRLWRRLDEFAFRTARDSDMKDRDVE